MFSSRVSLIAAAALAFAGAAFAQVEEGGLGGIDPWGIGYLEPDETALPTGMWQASRADDLLPLMRQTRTRNLTPAERQLLRRVVLTPASPPDGAGDQELLAERARLIYELGEAEAAADLLGRLETSPRGLDAESVSADLQLALGNERSACSRLLGRPREGGYWARLRAVCAALQDDMAGAELAVELAEAQGVSDPWLFSAVFSASGDIKDKPLARLDSGINLAISTKAGLEPPLNAVVASRPDLAAAMATRRSLPIELRVAAAGVAAEAGLLDAGTHRSIYAERVASEAFEPANPIEVAMQAVMVPQTPTEARARMVGAALRASSGNPARFAAASRLFEPDLARMPLGPATAREALTFAAAKLALDQPGNAGIWTAGAEVEGAPAPDAFKVALLDALIILGGGDRAPASVEAVSARLVEAATGAGQKGQAARVFALWTAFDIAPPAAARALMASERPAVNPAGWRMLAIKAAADAGAAGEAILGVLQQSRGDPANLNALDAVIAVEALQAADARDAARRLALEASGYWQLAR